MNISNKIDNNARQAGHTEDTSSLVYYDITDLLEDVHNNCSLTGIHRASIHTISNFAKSDNAYNYRLIALHPILNEVITTDLSFFEHGTFDVAEFRRFFIGETWQHLTVDTFLEKRYSNKYIRRVQRLRMMLKNTITRGRYFKRRGIYVGAAILGKTQCPIWTDPAMKHGDIIYIPGAIWRCNKLLDFLEKNYYTNKISIVIFVHDLAPVYASEFVPDNTPIEFFRWLTLMCNIASYFIVNSLSTRSQLEQFITEFGHKQADIRVVPLAHEFPSFERSGDVGLSDWNHGLPLLLTRVREKIRFCAYKPFVLCVGTFQPRKNNIGLLKVWQRLHERLGYATPRLVFAGTNGWMNEEFFEFLKATANISGTVSLAEAPSDFELGYLYSRCMFSIYPSFAEGWGLPIGESLWFGRPVIASNTTSMPEVGGDYVDYVDPMDLTTIETAILRMLEPKYRTDRANAIKTMPMRSWSDVSQSIFTELQSIVTGENPRAV